MDALFTNKAEMIVPLENGFYNMLYNTENK